MKQQNYLRAGLVNALFEAHLGLYASEKIHKNKILVNITALRAFPENGQIKHLNETFNYELAFDIAAEVLGEPIDLLEDAALRMLEKLRVASPDSLGFEIRLEKMAPPLQGPVEKSFAEIRWTHE